MMVIVATKEICGGLENGERDAAKVTLDLFQMPSNH